MMKWFMNQSGNCLSNGAIDYRFDVRTYNGEASCVFYSVASEDLKGANKSIIACYGFPVNDSFVYDSVTRAFIFGVRYFALFTEHLISKETKNYFKFPTRVPSDFDFQENFKRYRDEIKAADFYQRVGLLKEEE